MTIAGRKLLRCGIIDRNPLSLKNNYEFFDLHFTRMLTFFCIFGVYIRIICACVGFSKQIIKGVLLLTTTTATTSTTTTTTTTTFTIILFFYNINNLTNVHVNKARAR